MTELATLEFDRIPSWLLIPPQVITVSKNWVDPSLDKPTIGPFDSYKFVSWKEMIVSCLLYSNSSSPSLPDYSLNGAPFTLFPPDLTSRMFLSRMTALIDWDGIYVATTT
jgi:hypothetical protein